MVVARDDFEKISLYFENDAFALLTDAPCFELLPRVPKVDRDQHKIRQSISYRGYLGEIRFV